MWSHFEESSMLGLSHCGRSMNRETKSRGILWAIVTLILWGVTGFLLYKVFAEYFEYPVLTRITVESQSHGVDFPTVVVCNHNPIKCSQLFKISLTRPDIWKASGCRVGVQIEDYVQKAVLEYNIQNNFPIPRDFTDPGADGSRPLVDFWAHLYIDSKEIVDMLFYPETNGILLGLQEFLKGTYAEIRQTWDDTMETENYFAVKHLEQAIKARRLRAEILPAALTAKNGGDALTALSIRRLLSETYLDTFSANNFSQLVGNCSQSDARNVWIEAMVNGTPWISGYNYSDQLTAITNGFFLFLTVDVVPVYDEYPSLLWMFSDPSSALEGVPIIIDNIKSSYNSASKPGAKEPAGNTTPSPTTTPSPSRASEFDIIAFAQKLTHIRLADNAITDGDVLWDLVLNSIEDLKEPLYASTTDFIQKCTYQGELCQIDMFDSYLSVNYGFCHMFNPSMKNRTKVDDPVRANVEGRMGGLTMRFAIEEDEYIRVPQQLTTAGIKIGIFSFGTPPNIEEDGFNVMPGQSVDISLRPLKLIRLPSPHPSGCQADWSSTKYSYEEYDYDYKTCLRFCIGHQIATKCKCWDPPSNTYQIEYNGTYIPVYHWCNLSRTDTADAICVNEVRLRQKQSNASDEFTCPCKPACQISSYSIQTSSASFPAKGFMERYAAAAFLHPFAVRQQWQSIKDSLVEVNVFFHSFDELRTEEFPQHDIYSLASDIGGALGLLLGLCGFNLIEIAVMLWDMVLGKCSSAEDRRSHDKPPVFVSSAEQRTTSVNSNTGNKIDPLTNPLRTEMFLGRKLQGNQ